MEASGLVAFGGCTETDIDIILSGERDKLKGTYYTTSGDSD